MQSPEASSVALVPRGFFDVLGRLSLVAFHGVLGCEKVLLEGEQKGALGREGARGVRAGVLERESARACWDARGREGARACWDARARGVQHPLYKCALSGGVMPGWRTIVLWSCARFRQRLGERCAFLR